MSENRAKPLSYYEDALRANRAPTPTKDQRAAPAKSYNISPNLCSCLAICQLIGGLAGAIFVMFSDADMLIKIPAAAASLGGGVIGFALLIAASEAVRLLVEIRDK